MADTRTRIERLLNYKRYIDWLVERELIQNDRARHRRVGNRRSSGTTGPGGSCSVCGDAVVEGEHTP